MNEPSQPKSVRRIVLPNGRSIEVLTVFDETAARRELHICAVCSSDLVQPVAWQEASNSRWELTLHCPNCLWTETGTFDAEQIAAFEEQLEDGVRAVLDDLQRLARVNMSEEIDRFAAALHADVILPEDF